MRIDYDKAARDYEEMFACPMDVAQVEAVVDEYGDNLEQALDDEKISKGEFDCLMDACLD